MDHPTSRDATKAALADAYALWCLSPETATSEVVTAAADALAAGHDSPSLRDLARIPPQTESPAAVDDLINNTMSELGIPPIPTEDKQWAAARVVSKRMLSGVITPRELAAWAQTHIGTDGDVRTENLVVLDDLYKETDVGLTEDQLDESARLQAHALVAGEPSPGLVFSGGPANSDEDPHLILKSTIAGALLTALAVAVAIRTDGAVSVLAWVITAVGVAYLLHIAFAVVTYWWATKMVKDYL